MKGHFFPRAAPSGFGATTRLVLRDDNEDDCPAPPPAFGATTRLVLRHDDGDDDDCPAPPSLEAVRRSHFGDVFVESQAGTRLLERPVSIDYEAAIAPPLPPPTAVPEAKPDSEARPGSPPALRRSGSPPTGVERKRPISRSASGVSSRSRLETLPESDEEPATTSRVRLEIRRSASGVSSKSNKSGPDSLEEKSEAEPGLGSPRLNSNFLRPPIRRTGSGKSRPRSPVPPSEGEEPQSPTAVSLKVPIRKSASGVSNRSSKSPSSRASFQKSNSGSAWSDSGDSPPSTPRGGAEGKVSEVSTNSECGTVSSSQTPHTASTGVADPSPLALAFAAKRSMSTPVEAKTTKFQLEDDAAPLLREVSRLEEQPLPEPEVGKKRGVFSILKKMVGQGEKPPPIVRVKAEPVIIWDFDDTLVPTTFITEIVIPSVDEPKRDMPLGEDSSYYQALRLHDSHVVNILRASKSVAITAIVTLGTPLWVQSCLNRFFPGIKAALDELDISIFYADRRGVMVEMLDQDIGLTAKRVAMSTCLHTLYKGSMSAQWNVLSIGDSAIEIQALKDCLRAKASALDKNKCNDAICKTVKLKERPTMEELKAQLKIIQPQLANFAVCANDFDKNLEGRTPMLRKSLSLTALR